MTDETRPTTPLPQQRFYPKTWMDNVVARPELSPEPPRASVTPSSVDENLPITIYAEPPPDMAGFKTETIREGAPRRAVEPLPDAQSWQEPRPKSSKAEIVLLVMLVLICLAEVAQWAYLLLVIGDGW